MKLGIIGAMDVEVATLKEKMKDKCIRTIAGSDYCEGKLEGLPLNRALRTEDGEIYDIIAGNFFICGLGEENFCSLSPELAEKFKEEFKHPEKFVRIAGKILAVKQPVPGDGAPEKPQKGPEL